MQKLNPLIFSLTQSALLAVENLLKEFQELNPSFKYQLAYGTTYDTDCPEDTFSIAVEVGAISRIPSHYTTINGEESLLFAGSTALALSIINPISVKYLDNVNFTVPTQYEIGPVENNQTDTNYYPTDNIVELDDESDGKVESSIRLLEALSMFMYRKGLVANNFTFTFLPDNPLITGQFEYGIYRLSQSLYIDCKFEQNNIYNLVSGENIRLFMSFDNGATFDEYYNVVDYLYDFGVVDNTFPQSNKIVTQNIVNQHQIMLTLSAPHITNIGANKKLYDYVKTSNINSLKNIVMKVSFDNGKTYDTYKCNYHSLHLPLAINAFSSSTYYFVITTPITKVGD